MTDYMLNNKFNDPFNKVQFGVSIGERNQLEEFSKVLRSGARMVEVDIASVYGLGGEQGNAADTISKTEREAIANLAKVNDIDLSVHAPWALNFSGLNPQSGKKEQIYEHMVDREIGTALQFADDIGKKVGRQNIPVIFHASSDNFSDPDKNLVYSIYDSEENKIIQAQGQDINLGIDTTNINNPDEIKTAAKEKFIGLYGKEFYDKIFGSKGSKQLGFISDDGKVILKPEGSFEFQKEKFSQQFNKERANINLTRRNLEYNKLEALSRQARAKASSNVAELNNIKRELEDIERMLDSTEQEYEELKIRENNLDKRFIPYDNIAPKLAAEGIAKAAMFSYKNTDSKPLILVENPMSPEMSLSNPKDTAESVRLARQEFANELQQKEHLSSREAERISSELIGINLHIIHFL